MEGNKKEKQHEMRALGRDTRFWNKLRGWLGCRLWTLSIGLLDRHTLSAPPLGLTNLALMLLKVLGTCAKLIGYSKSIISPDPHSLGPLSNSDSTSCLGRPCVQFMLRRETERMLAKKSPIFSFFSWIGFVRIMISGKTCRTDKAEFAPPIFAAIISM